MISFLNLFTRLHFFFIFYIYINNVVISVVMYVSHHHGKTAGPICPKFCTYIHLASHPKYLVREPCTRPL